MGLRVVTRVAAQFNGPPINTPFAVVDLISRGFTESASQGVALQPDCAARGDGGSQADERTHDYGSAAAVLTRAGGVDLPGFIVIVAEESASPLSLGTAAAAAESSSGSGSAPPDTPHGVVHLFQASADESAAWANLGTLFPSDPTDQQAGMRFGRGVSASEWHVVIGAPRFRDRFVGSAGPDPDESLLDGHPYDGRVWIFTYDTDAPDGAISFEETQRLLPPPPDDLSESGMFGLGVAIDGPVLAVGSPGVWADDPITSPCRQGKGVIYVYARDPADPASPFAQASRLLGTVEYGCLGASIAALVASNLATVAAGVAWGNQVHVFHPERPGADGFGGNWTHTTTLSETSVPAENPGYYDTQILAYGLSVSLAMVADNADSAQASAAAGDSGSGSESGAAHEEDASESDPNYHVLLAVGAFSRVQVFLMGTATPGHVFVHGGTWVQEGYDDNWQYFNSDAYRLRWGSAQILEPPDAVAVDSTGSSDAIGSSLAFDRTGRSLAVGSPGREDLDLASPPLDGGAVFLFRPETPGDWESQWRHVATLDAGDDAEALDEVGRSVAVGSGGRVVVAGSASRGRACEALYVFTLPTDVEPGIPLHLTSSIFGTTVAVVGDTMVLDSQEVYRRQRGAIASAVTDADVVMADNDGNPWIACQPLDAQGDIHVHPTGLLLASGDSAAADSEGAVHLASHAHNISAAPPCSFEWFATLHRPDVSSTFPPTTNASLAVRFGAAVTLTTSLMAIAAPGAELVAPGGEPIRGDVHVFVPAGGSAASVADDPSQEWAPVAHLVVPPAYRHVAGYVFGQSLALVEALATEHSSQTLEVLFVGWGPDSEAAAAERGASPLILVFMHVAVASGGAAPGSSSWTFTQALSPTDSNPLSGYGSGAIVAAGRALAVSIASDVAVAGGGVVDTWIARDATATDRDATGAPLAPPFWVYEHTGLVVPGSYEANSGYGTSGIALGMRPSPIAGTVAAAGDGEGSADALQTPVLVVTAPNARTSLGAAYVFELVDPRSVRHGWMLSAELTTTLGAMANADWLFGYDVAWDASSSAFVFTGWVPVAQWPLGASRIVFVSPEGSDIKGDGLSAATALRSIGAALRRGGCATGAAFATATPFSTTGSCVTVMLLPGVHTIAATPRPRGTYYITSPGASDGSDGSSSALTTTIVEVLPGARFLEQSFASAHGTISRLHVRAATAGVETAVGAGATTLSEGGLVFVRGTEDSLSLEQVVLEGGSAVKGGAVFAGAEATVILDQCLLLNNSAAFGGALAADQGSTVVATDTLFVNNVATEASGGAIAADAATVRVLSTSPVVVAPDIEVGVDALGVAAATAAIHALDVSIDGAAWPPVTGVTTSVVANNTARFAGGGVFAGFGATVSVEGALIEGNTAHMGGAVAVDLTTVTLSACALAGNAATDAGGAVHATLSPANAAASVLAGCEVTENVAARGGGVAASLDARVSLRGSSVRGNVATGGAGGGGTGGGGAIHAESGAIITLTDTAVTGNAALVGGGGGVALTGSGTTVAVDGASSVEGNRAGTNGGGIICSAGSVVTVDAGSISHNSATRNGGGLTTTDCDVLLTDTFLVDNAAGAESGRGGAIYAEVSFGETTECGAVRASHQCVLSGNATMGGNSAAVGGGVYSAGVLADEWCTENAELCANGGTACDDDGVGSGSGGAPTVVAFAPGTAWLGAANTALVGADAFWVQRPPDGAHAAAGGGDTHSTDTGARVFASRAVRLDVSGLPAGVPASGAWGAGEARGVDFYGATAVPLAGDTTATVVSASAVNEDDEGNGSDGERVVSVPSRFIGATDVLVSASAPAAQLSGLQLAAMPGSQVSVRLQLGPASGVLPVDVELAVDACEAGHGPGVTLVDCSPCGKGYFSLGSDAAPSGDGSGDGGSAPQCQPCSPGRYGPADAWPVECLGCPLGTFSDAVTATSDAQCVSCGTGMTTSGTGTSDARDCVAAVGFASVLSLSHLSAAEASQLIRSANETLAEPCPPGTNCTATGTDLRALPLLPGSWRAAGSTLKVHECLPGVCAGGNGLVPVNASDPNSPLVFVRDTQCEAGHSGVMCFACTQGWARQGTDTACTVCIDRAASAGAFVLWLVVAIAVVVAIVWLVRRVRQRWLSLLNAAVEAELAETGASNLAATDGASDGAKDRAGAGAAGVTAGVDPVSGRDEAGGDGSGAASAAMSARATHATAPDALTLVADNDDATAEAPATSSDHLRAGATGRSSRNILTRAKSFLGASQRDLRRRSNKPDAPQLNRGAALERALAALQEDAERALNALPGARMARGLRSKLKIALSFAQVITALPIVLSHVAFPLPMQWFQRAFGWVNLDVLRVFSVGCVFPSSAYSHMVGATVAPAVLLALVALMAAVLRRKWRDPADREWVDSRAMAALMFVTFAVYPSTSSTIMLTLVCDTLETGERFLRADPSIDCKGEHRGLWILYAVVAAAVYPVGVLVLQFRVLWTRRRRLNPFVRDDTVARLGSGGAASEGSSDPPGDKLSVDNPMHAKPRLTGGADSDADGSGDDGYAVAASAPTAPSQSTADKTRHGAGPLYVLRQLERREVDATLAPVTFLYESYLPRYWWFEIWQSAYKLLITGVTALFYSGTPTQIVFALLVALAAVAVLGETHPYVEAADNRLATMANYCVVLSLLGALMLHVDVAGEHPWQLVLFDAAFLFVTWGVIVLGVVYAIDANLVARYRAIREEYPDVPPRSARMVKLYFGAAATEDSGGSDSDGGQDRKRAPSHDGRRSDADDAADAAEPLTGASGLEAADVDVDIEGGGGGHGGDGGDSDGGEKADAVAVADEGNA